MEGEEGEGEEDRGGTMGSGRGGVCRRREGKRGGVGRGLGENPALGATLGIDWTQNFQPKSSERFFQNWGGPRAPE